MARATHLTISTADRIRLDARRQGHGYNEDDENEQDEIRQEVQVSVTYTLEAGDTNLVRLAETKALEVKLAHEAIWNLIGASSSGNGAFSGSTPGRCSGRHDDVNTGDEEDEDKEDENDDPDDDPLAGLPHHGDDPFSGGPSAGGAARPHPAGLTGQHDPFPTRSVLPSHNGHPIATGHPALARSAGQDTHGNPAPAVDPTADLLTGPQRILIRSRAKKAGLTPYALESLAYQQFRVWKVEKLTKEQAASLLDALDRDLKERELNQNDNKNDNKNDREQGIAVAARVV